MRDQPIVMTDSDVQRLRGMLARRAASGRDQEHLKELETELERALVLGTTEVPNDVVMMNSRVRVLDLTSRERHEFVLVLPGAANVAAQRISVLAPLGTALIGHSEGDEVDWLMPGGFRRLRIERVSREELSGAMADGGSRPRGSAELWG